MKLNKIYITLKFMKTLRHICLAVMLACAGVSLSSCDLTQFMEELSGASNDWEYNCRTRYEELFPDVSERTRMRDYQTMKNIGYEIRWDEYEQRHSVTGYLYQIRETFD